MKFTLRDSISKKIFSLVGIPFIACIIIAIIGFLSLKVVDRALLITRSERDHTVNFYEAARAFEVYANTGDAKFYAKFSSHIETAVKLSGIFGSLISDLKVKPKEEIAQNMARWFPSVDDDQASDIVAIVDILSSRPLVVSLVEIAQEGNRLALQFRALAEKYKKTKAADERKSILSNIEKIIAEMDRAAAMFSTGVGKLSTWAVSLTKETLWIALVLLSVICGVFSTVTVRSILRPLNAVVGFARKVAKGELEERLRIDSKDETKVLADVFNQMLGSLQQSITQMENYLNNAPMPVMAVDQGFNIQFINQKGAELVQTSVNDAIGRKCHDLFKNEHCNTAECRVGQAMEQKEISSGQTVLHGAKEMPIHYIGAPLLDASGDVIGGVEYITDVSELKKIEEALESANDFLQGRIGEATRNITSATREILASTNEQAATASQQSAAVNQTLSTVEQARQTARQSAERAKRVAGVAQESSIEAEDGFSAVERTLEGVNRIKAQMESIAQNILSLSEKTQQIGEIIETVNDVADQSNLLSLNASIEAARAGEAGKGFAVVAGEVRNLAVQSREATARVQEILEEIQKATNTAVMVTEEGSKRADAGVLQAEKAGRAIQSINKGIRGVTQTIQQIAASAGEQLAGMDQIGTAMESIGQATTQSEAGTRQVEEAVHDLNAQAEQLSRVVEQYTAV
jgi:PAS domain S-box-containing protein